MDNPRIIHAPMNGRRYAVTSPITQYDYGYLLLPEGAELPTVYEIDFSNDEKHGTSLTVYGGAEGAEVPEELIRTGKDVYAFYYFVGDGYGKTEFTWRLPNHCRPSRDGETPTPTQQSSIDQLIVRSNDAVESAEQSAEDASTSAQNASADAERAEDAKTDAQNFATQAEQSATDAHESASQASASASASAQSASQSAQIKADVEDLAEEAQGYAQSAEQSAQNAHTYALSANAASDTAENFADVASGYASQAQSSAQTASANAQDASQSAKTASQKATESAQSASQALTYKTDAESAKTASQTAQGLAESARDSAISAKNDAEQAKADAITAKEEAESAVASISGALDDKADVITDTASGAVASFTDGADDLPLKSLVVNIEPKQDGTGDPSPDNVRPISGWTGMQIQRDGTNLFDQTLLKDQAEWNIIRFYAPVGTPLTMSTNQPVRATSGLIVFFRHPNESQTSNNNLYLNHSVTKIVRAAGYVEIVHRNANNISSFADWNYQIEILGGTPTDYEPYRGRSIPINWQTEAGTVYGGKLDVLTGKLTVYPYYASYNGETLTGEWISDRDVYASGTTPTIGAQVVNIGAQGMTVQLEPHEIASLLGVNNIFADTGDCSVEYRADTKLYIERLTAPDSADMIADANIVSGQYFMVGNTLYKATANIANGGQITVGTNCTRVSLAQALNEINA